MQDGRGLSEHAESEGADDKAGGEVSEHRAKADLLEQGHRQDGRPKKDDDRGKVQRVRRVRFCGHRVPLR